MIQCGLRSK